MLTHFGKFFRIDFRLNKYKPLLVGVSGGPDSLCLLDLLIKCDFEVVIAHLNHKLRSDAETDAEARWVGGLAASLGVKFVSEDCDVQAMADAKGYSLEQAAREGRYRFLFEQAEIFGAQAVVVGHNADDQIETILMHFLRGAGLDGLLGMQQISVPNPWSAEIPLLRPLLTSWRSQILDYCDTHHLTPLMDSSNTDTKFFRNRLRHKLVPLLEEYVPGIRPRLQQMSEILTDDRAVLDEITTGAWATTLREQGNGFVTFDVLKLANQPLAIQRRLIRRAMAAIRPNIRDLDFAAVERALSILQSQPGLQQQDVCLGVRAFIEEGIFYLAASEADLPSQQWPQMPVDENSLAMTLPAKQALAEGWFLTAEIIKVEANFREQALKNRDPYRAWIDVGEQVPHLNIRSRQPGDRLAPFGMGGTSKKLSNFMIDQKIPKRARAKWPLVCVEDKIIWVVGQRQAHGTGVREDTQQVLFLELIAPL